MQLKKMAEAEVLTWLPRQAKGSPVECFRGAQSQRWQGWNETTALPQQPDSTPSKISCCSFSTFFLKIKIVNCMPSCLCIALKS